MNKPEVFNYERYRKAISELEYMSQEVNRLEKENAELKAKLVNMEIRARIEHEDKMGRSDAKIERKSRKETL